MVRIYTIDDDSERYIPINLDELVPSSRIPFEIFTRDGSIIKSLLDKGSTYSLFARKMIEKQAVGSFFIKQGNALRFDEYLHNAARLKKMILDPHFFESRYREFRDKWFIIDKHVLNSGIPFAIPLGAMKFPVFGEIPFTVDNDAAYRHLLDLNSDIAVRKQDIDAYYNYLHTVLYTDWIEDPLLKIRIRREKVKVWCYKVLVEAYNNSISQNTLAGLYKHIGLIMPLMANSFDHIGTFLFFDVSDMFLYIHSTNVCLLSMIIGRLMNLEEDFLLNLGISAMLHDVGRAAIDDEASEISDNKAEIEIFKSHVLRGKELLDHYKGIPAVAKVVALTHHERIDGSGYIYGLTGDKIHQFAKIVGVADTFENHVVTGFKNNAMKRGKAIEDMLKNGQRFDPDILKTFIHDFLWRMTS